MKKASITVLFAGGKSARKTMKAMMVCVGNAGMTSSPKKVKTCLET